MDTKVSVNTQDSTNKEYGPSVILVVRFKIELENRSTVQLEATTSWISNTRPLHQPTFGKSSAFFAYGSAARQTPLYPCVNTILVRPS